MITDIHQALSELEKINLTPAFVLGVLGLVITLWELLRSGQKIIKIGWSGWVNIFLTLGAKNRQPIDVSHLQTSPPQTAAKNIATLQAMGFRRLGEAQVKSPFRPPITVWIFVQLENRIQAELAGKRVGFSTYFQKKTLLVTDYPNGEHIEAPTYQSHTITTNLKDAYQYHLKQIVKFSQIHGQPHPIRNMNDYLQWEVVGRKNYALKKLSRWLTGNIVRLVAFLYGILALTLTPMLFNAKQFLSAWKISFLSSQEVSIYAMIIVASPAIFLSRYFNRWNVQQTHKDSRRLKNQQPKN